MRVSTRNAFLQGVSMMQRLQSAMDYTQRQISSGRRILTPSDDPIASARSLEVRESLSRLEQFDRNATVATSRLAQEEESLNSVNNVLQRIRELALQANNATQSNESRRLIAVEMRQNLDNLVQLANQKDGNGRHLFSGNLEDVQPVSRAGASFTYNGDQGQRLIQVGETRQIADGDSGASVFFNIRNGNGDFASLADASNSGTGVLGSGSLVDPSAWDQSQYTVNFTSPGNYEVRDSSATVIASGAFQPGDTLSFRGVEFSISGQPAAGDVFYVQPSSSQDVFTSVERLVTAVEMTVTDDTSRAALNNGVNSGLLNIDQAIGNILDIRTQVGSRLATIESQIDSNGAFALTYDEILADIEDLDYAEALSRLSMEATTLEAAQKSFIRTQALSLFNYF